MLNRWIETEGLLDAAGELGFGMIGFTPLAQGMLTGRYLDGIPADSRATADGSLDRRHAQRRDTRTPPRARRDRRTARADARAARPRVGTPG